MEIDVIVRRMKWKEEAIHSPRGLIKDECYLGRGVDVLNIYERCGHACSYCYVEWPWSPGTIVVRSNIVDRIRRDLLKKYLGKSIVINLGSATDPYQPIEEKYKFTRRIIKLLMRFDASFYICTKSNLILRDLDLISSYENCWVGFTISSLNDDFCKVFEPNAPKPSIRIEAIRKLIENNILVIVRISPIIPMINDSIEDLRKLVEELRSVGVNYIVAEILKLDRRRFIFNGWNGKPNWKKSLKNSLIEWRGEKLVEAIEKMYYREGETLYGYQMPKESIRFNILKNIKKLCENLKFTTCNMGLNIKKKLSNWFSDEGKFMCACHAKKPSTISLRRSKSGQIIWNKWYSR